MNLLKAVSGAILALWLIFAALAYIGNAFEKGLSRSQVTQSTPSQHSEALRRLRSK